LACGNNHVTRDTVTEPVDFNVQVLRYAAVASAATRQSGTSSERRSVAEKWRVAGRRADAAEVLDLLRSSSLSAHRDTSLTSPDRTPHTEAKEYTKDEAGRRHFAFGGLGRADGPGHGHYAVDTDGSRQVFREPFDPVAFKGRFNATDHGNSKSD
jgi:hypothetical protein